MQGYYLSITLHELSLPWCHLTSTGSDEICSVPVNRAPPTLCFSAGAHVGVVLPTPWEVGSMLWFAGLMLFEVRRTSSDQLREPPGPQAFTRGGNITALPPLGCHVSMQNGSATRRFYLLLFGFSNRLTNIFPTCVSAEL